MTQLLHTGMLAGAFLIGLFGILLAVPACRLREVVFPLVEWLTKPRDRRLP